ncbi:MAG: DUF6470 family protein [Oscillospiraceae bacterium]|jgi:hypothetical protein|nr:DUF6470 family protein [Oscillospiraceae bacterium]
MAMPRINIRQTQGAIEIETRRAELQIARSRRLQLSMRQIAARMTIERQMPRIRIDQTESFASAGLRSPLSMMDDFYRRSLSEGLSSISSIVQEGLRFLRIEEGGSPIRSIAQGRGVRTRSFGAVAMPSVRPQIMVDPGSMQIQWTPHTLETNWEWLDSEVEFIPHQVSIRMNPYPSIEITLDDKLDFDIPVATGVGEHVDASG